MMLTYDLLDWHNGSSQEERARDGSLFISVDCACQMELSILAATTCQRRDSGDNDNVAAATTRERVGHWSLSTT